MPTTPKLSPEVEKEFDEEFVVMQAPSGQVFQFDQEPDRIKSFIAKVIAEEVEKAKRERVKKDAELAFKSIESVNPVVYAAKVKRDILAQLTPDQLSE